MNDAMNGLTQENIEELKKAMADISKDNVTNTINWNYQYPYNHCPNCGSCPTCGRRYRTYPYWEYSPYITYTIT